MATAKLTVTAPIDLVTAGQIDSIAQLVSTLLTDASYGDVTQSHFKQSVCTPIAIGPTAPASPFVGLHWWDTSGTRAVLKAYTGSTWHPVSHYRQELEPAAAVAGDLWYDETLKMLRIYETEDEITGWHPVSLSYQLMENEGAQPIEAEHVVSHIAPVGSKRPCSITGGSEKLTNIRGVALEDIAVTSPASHGVVAVVGGGATVTVKVDTNTHALLVGEWLVSSTTAGVSRSAGQAVINPYVSSTVRQWGKPLGAFAQAMESNSSGSTVSIVVRIADALGEGMMVKFTGKQIIALGDTIPGGSILDVTTTVDGTSRDVDLEDTPRSGTSVLESDKHGPIAGAYISAHISLAGNANEIVTMSFEDHELHIGGYTSAPGADIRGSMSDVFAITDDGAGAMGQLLAVSGSTTTAAAPNGYDIYCTGYLC